MVVSGLVVLLPLVDVPSVAPVLVRPRCGTSLLVPVTIAGRSAVRALGPAPGFVAGPVRFVLEAAAGPVRRSLLVPRPVSGPATGPVLTALLGLALFLLTAVALAPLVTAARGLARPVLVGVALLVPALLSALLLAMVPLVALAPLSVLGIAAPHPLSIPLAALLVSAILPTTRLLSAALLAALSPAAILGATLALTLLAAALSSALPTILLAAALVSAPLLTTLLLSAALLAAISGPGLTLLVPVASTTSLATVPQIRFLGRVGSEVLGPPSAVLAFVLVATAAAFAAAGSSTLVPSFDLVASLTACLLLLSALMWALLPPAFLLHAGAVAPAWFTVRRVRVAPFTGLVLSPSIATAPLVVALPAAEQSVEPAAIAAVSILSALVAAMAVAVARSLGSSIPPASPIVVVSVVHD